jgi:hypothetical protein
MGKDLEDFLKKQLDKERPEPPPPPKPKETPHFNLAILALAAVSFFALWLGWYQSNTIANIAAIAGIIMVLFWLIIAPHLDS